MRNVLSICGTALPGFAEPTRKPYQINYYDQPNQEAIAGYVRRNRRNMAKWMISDSHLLQYYPVSMYAEARFLMENVAAVNEWMHNTRILDIVHNGQQPQISVILPQYVSLRRDWILALNTFIQAADGIEPIVSLLTRLLNNEDLWQNPILDAAQDRERLFMLRWFLWQLLKNK